MIAQFNDDILELLSQASTSYANYLPNLEEEIANKVEEQMSELEKNKGALVPSKENFRKLAVIQSGFNTIINDTDYGKHSALYLSAYEKVTKLSNQYFNAVTDNFSPTEAMEAVKTAAIDTTIENLGKVGLLTNTNSTFRRPVVNALTQAMATGTKYTTAVKQVRDIITGGLNVGPLERYAKPLAVDSLNRFSRNYMNIAALGLGLDWYMYTGSLIKTSRCFCIGCVKIKYIHRSEFQQVLDMDFPELKDCEINPKTGLAEGLIQGTNPSNFTENAGGWGCEHQLIPVPENYVPESAKTRV